MVVRTHSRRSGDASWCRACPGRSSHGHGTGASCAPRTGFDLVHAVSLAVPSVPRSVEVVAVHDVAWRHRPEDYPRRGRRWHEAALRRALRHASHFVVPSEAVARDMIEAGAPERAVSIIPLGSDILPEPDDVGATALLEQLGVRGEFLLSVGTLEPRKNLARLFEAYGVARRSLPEPWPLVVVGPPGWGPEPAHGEGIVFTGRVDDGTLASLYASGAAARLRAVRGGIRAAPGGGHALRDPCGGEPTPHDRGRVARGGPHHQPTTSRRPWWPWRPTTGCGPS